MANRQCTLPAVCCIRPVCCVVQAIDAHEMAQQHTAQASAAGSRAAAAEEQAQQFEAHGKFADAAAAALQADRSALLLTSLSVSSRCVTLDTVFVSINTMSKAV